MVVIKKSDVKDPFSFSFVNQAGISVVGSERFSTKLDALSGIEAVRRYCADSSCYELKNSSDGKYFFEIKSKRGETIATSALFTTPELRDEAIELMKKECIDIRSSGY